LRISEQIRFAIGIDAVGGDGELLRFGIDVELGPAKGVGRDVVALEQGKLILISLKAL